MSQRVQAEAALRRQQQRALRHLLNRGQGMEVRVWDLSNDVHQQAYGASSGSRGNTYRTIRGIGTGDDFFPADTLRSGSFQEGWLWTDDQTPISAGQEVEFIDGTDGRSRRYIVEGTESLGWTTEIFTRYRLSSVDKA